MLVNTDDMFEYMKSEDGAIQLGHSNVRFLDVKRVIESVPTIDAVPVEWLLEKRDNVHNFMAEGTINWLLYEWQKEQEAR